MSTFDFRPKTLSGNSSVSDRRVPLDGADNFRDLGGYSTADGRRVRRGLLYRSGHLGKLSESDLEMLKSLGLKKVTDFRGPVEKNDDPNRIPDGALYVERPVDVAGNDLRKGVKALMLGKKGLVPEDYLKGVNRIFVREYSTVFGEWFRELARDAEALPQVFHCTAGKDRTGFASALFLRMLGASTETAMEDYLLSMEFMADTIESIVRKTSRRSPVKGAGERIRPLLGVDEMYLEAAFQAIDEDWGDFDTFIRDGLGLNEEDIHALKDRFLE